MVINQGPSSSSKPLTAASTTSTAAVSITTVKMLPSIAPSKFDICLLSGILFNFACVTAQYWPPAPGHRSYAYGQDPYSSPSTSPYGPSSPSSYGGYQVSSGPIRVQTSPWNGSPNSGQNPVQRYDPFPPPIAPMASSYPSSPSSYPSYQQSGYPQPQPSYGQSYYGHSWSSPSASPSYQQQRPYDYSGYPRSPPAPQPYYPRTQAPSPTSPSSSWYNQRPGYQPFYPEVDRRTGSWPQGTGSPPSYQPYGGMYPSPAPPPMSGGGYYPPSTYPFPVPPRLAPSTAVAKMKGSNSKIEGEIRFVQSDNRYVQITGRIMGLVPGAHGLHVHEGQGANGQDTCANIGGHFNPSGVDHGGKSEWIRHVGDLGNIFADHDGTAFFDITDTMITLSGANSVVNRTIVVTEFGDDLGKGSDAESKKTGNAGKPLVCGQILLVPPTPFGSRYYS